MSDPESVVNRDHIIDVPTFHVTGGNLVADVTEVSIYLLETKHQIHGEQLLNVNAISGRVSMSPVVAKKLAVSLAELVRFYEERWGKLPDANQ